MQNVAARVGRALSNTVTAAVAGGSGATTAECRARNTQPASTPSFLSSSDDYEIIGRDQDASSSSSSSSSPPCSSPTAAPAVPLADQVTASEVNQAIEIVLQSLPAAAAAQARAAAAAEEVSPEAVDPSGSASPASSDGGAAAHMRDAEESLAAFADEQQQLQTPHAQQCLRATLTHLLSDRRVRVACELALTQSPEFAQALLRYDREACGGGGGGAGEESALADLYPIAARTALTAARREGGGGESAGGENDGGENNNNNNNNRNPLAAAVAEALSALSSAQETLAGLGAAAVVSMLEAGVHIVGWTRHLAQVARGEETGPWTRAEGGGAGGRARARARSFRARLPPRSFRPANLDGWVKLVTGVAMMVVAVIFVRRRGRLAARGGGV